jgi:predicted RND superfamily exporter protein
MNTFRDQIFSRIARFSFFRRRPLIWGALILAVLSGFLISRLHFQSDVLNLLPENAPRTQDLVKFLKEFGSGDSLYIVLDRKSGGEVESLIPFVEALADRLMATGEFTEIIGRMEPGVKEKMARLFLRKAILYLSKEDLKIVEGRLSDRGIEEQLRLLKTKVSSMFSTALAPYDPLELFPLLQKNIPLPPYMTDSDSQGYLISTDKKMILLIAQPRGSAPDVDYDERLVKKVRGAEIAARQAFSRPPGNFSSGLESDLRIGLTGGFIHALEDSRMIKRELVWNFSLSLVGVLSLIFLAFRVGALFLYALFPLLVSPLLTLGLFSPFLDHLNESTGAFSAIILGLSIDFIILLYSRYQEEKGQGLEVPGALSRSLVTVGPGVFIGAITTTAAYYALLVSDFRGVKDLGLLTGTGILVSLACALFLFPALVAWREAKMPESISRKISLTSWGLERLSSLSLRIPLFLLFFCGVFTLFFIFGAFWVDLDNDPRRLRPANHPSLLLERQVQEKMGEGFETLILLIQTRTPEEAVEIQETWREHLERGISSGLPISRFETLSSFIPPPSQQRENLKWMESRGKEAFDPDRVERKVREVLRKEGFRAEPFELGLKALREMLSHREILTWEEVESSPLKNIGARFLKPAGESFLSAAYVHLQPGFWSHPRARDFLATMKESNPRPSLTSSKLVQKELEDLMTRESWRILGLALAAVSLLIYFDFRSWVLTFLSILPVVLACLWTLGIMGFLGIHLNFMNLVVFTMVLGIGVDYGVHVLHRGLQSFPGKLEQELQRINKGIVLAGLTTLASFGSLVFSAFPGLRSMGAVALMGVGFSLFFALTLVPVLFQKWAAKGARTQSQGGRCMKSLLLFLVVCIMAGSSPARAQWQSLGGIGKDVAAQGNTAWTIGADNGIWYHSGGTWQPYPGGGRGHAIDIAPTEFPM